MVVKPLPNDPVGSGTLLLNALGGITGTAADPWLLKIEPGIYDIGLGTLVMKPFVDIEGSGEGMTTIRGAGNPLLAPEEPTVLGADNAELRFLTVESVGGTSTLGMQATGTSPRLTHVTVQASGASLYNSALRSYNGANPAITDATLSADGYAVQVEGASLKLHNVRVTSSGYAIVLYQGSMTAIDVTITGQTGVEFFNNSSAVIERSSITATGAALSIINSTAQIGASKLAGSVQLTNSTAACAGVYDGSFAAIGPTCF